MVKKSYMYLYYFNENRYLCTKICIRYSLTI